MKSDIVVILEKAKAEIQARMASEGINASGRSSASFVVVEYDGGVMLKYGGPNTAPLATLEVGRPGGNVPGGFRMTKNGTLDVSNTFKAILVQWAKDKGIADFGWGRATMLGRRIAAQGTLRHSQPVDVYTTIIEDVAAKVKLDVTARVVQQVKSQLHKEN